MQYFESKRLREERADLQAKAVELRKQELTPETREQLSRMVADLEQYDQKIQDAELIERTDNLIITQPGNKTPIQPFSPKAKVVTEEDKANAIAAWALYQGGFSNLIRSEHYEAAERCGVQLNNTQLSISRSKKAPKTYEDISRAETEAFTNPDKGVLTTLAPGIERAMLAFGGMLPKCKRMRTPTAAPFKYITHDSTQMIAKARAKLEAGEKLTPAIDDIILTGYSCGSEVSPLAKETLRDNAVAILELAMQDAAESIARKQNTWITTGTGVKEPRGIQKSVTSTWVYPDPANNAVDLYDVLVHIQDALEESYDANASWVFHKTWKSELRLLVDALGRPMWQDSLTVGAPSQLLNKPYTVNNDMPEFGELSQGATIIYGNLDKFVVREVGGVDLTVLHERWADINAVGMVAFAEIDSAVIQPKAFVAGEPGTGSGVNCGIVPVAAG
jgi:HK97 family phage major capsid protein